MPEDLCYCVRICRGLIRRSSRTVRRHIAQDHVETEALDLEEAEVSLVVPEVDPGRASPTSADTEPNEDDVEINWSGLSVSSDAESRRRYYTRTTSSGRSGSSGHDVKRQRTSELHSAHHPAALLRRSTLQQYGSLNSDAFGTIYDELFETQSPNSFDPFDDTFPDVSSPERASPASTALIFPADSDDGDFEPIPLENLANDPLYLHLDTYGDVPLNEDSDTAEPSVSSATSDDDELPSAFNENPIIRNAYIRAFVNSAFKSATHAQTHDFLDAIHSTIQSLSRQTNELDLDDDLAGMARTLRTVEKRLGVDPDDSIIYYFVCPVCWARHHPSELPELESAICTRDDCHGRLYTAQQTPTGALKRVPNLICPYHPIRAALRRFLLRPGIPEALQHWRGPGDEPGDVPPVSKAEWSLSVDPSEPLNDIYDGWMWRSLRAFCKRTWNRRHRRVVDTELENETPRRFVSLKFGLVIHINIDWFQATKRRVHSSGAIFATIDNLPRGVRYLRENTFLLCTIPGPHEPTTEQLNELLDLIVEDMVALYGGLSFAVHGYNEPQKIYATLPFVTADTPARLKAGGYTAQNSEGSPSLCTVCKKPFASLIHADCFDRDTFEMRNPMKDLHYKFKAAAYPELAEEIADEHGVRYTPLDSLPNWNIPQSVPPEPMHMFFPGKAAHIHKNILLKFGMFSGQPRSRDTPLDRLEIFLSDILWPSTCGRVNSKIASGGGKPKADEWRNLMTVYPVAVAVAWNLFDTDDGIDAPHARRNTRMHAAATRVQDMLRKRREKYQNQADNPELVDQATGDQEPDRNYLHHYLNILRFCAGLRIVTSRSISPAEAERAQQFFSQAAQSWAAMDCHLTPNFHVSMHILEFIYFLGSIYGFWVFAYERFMGILSSFRTNGRSGGEMEATLMRAWWKTLRCQELMRHLEEVPNKTVEDLATIDILAQAMKGGAEGDRQRGTLMNYLAAIAAEDPHAQVTANPGIKFPRRSSLMDTRKEGLYTKILVFARTNLPQLRVASDAGAQDIVATHTYYSHRNAKHATATVNGVKYGSGTHAHGAGCSLAFIHSRNAAHIHHLLTATFTPIDPDGAEATINIAIVQRFVPARSSIQNNAPWHEWDTDLGIALWNIEELCEIEVIDMKDLSGLFALAPLKIHQEDFWVSCSMDHYNSEPDTEGDVQEEQDG